MDGRPQKLKIDTALRNFGWTSCKGIGDARENPCYRFLQQRLVSGPQLHIPWLRDATARSASKDPVEFTCHTLGLTCESSFAKSYPPFLPFCGCGWKGRRILPGIGSAGGLPAVDDPLNMQGLSELWQGFWWNLAARES